MQVHILDFDGSIVEQPFAVELIEARKAKVVPARDLAHGLRIVASRGAIQAFEERLDIVDPGSRDVVFLGSGDFHHLTYLLLRRVSEQVILIHFDNHPDWVRFPATLNCGSWINHALKLPHVIRVITIGPCGRDLSLPELKTANLSAIREGRLEVYAWEVPSTRLFWRPVGGPGVQTYGRTLQWRNLSEEPWMDFVEELCGRLPETAIWVTLDKDVLTPDEAVTNWDQGRMNLEQVMTAIEHVAGCRKIVGVDICGDYSTPRFRDPLRTFLSKTDRPSKNPNMTEATLINDDANRRILTRLRAILH
jgi:arginase family enzyme